MKSWAAAGSTDPPCAAWSSPAISPANRRLTAGVDAIEVARIQAALDRFGERFIRRLYTDREQRYCRGRTEELAARFAGKEAISKALGTGMRGVLWRELEVLNDRRGKPTVHLHGAAAVRARELGLTTFEISLTHSRELAIAFVIATAD